MKKKALSVTLILMLMLSAVLLISCSGNGDSALDLQAILDSFKRDETYVSKIASIPGTDIQVSDTVIYLSPTGKYQINPIVMPEDATDKTVIYQMMTPTDAKYVTVDSNGLLTAKAAKEDGSIAIRMFLKSDRDIYMDLTVYVQIVSATKITFASSEISVVLGAANSTTISPILVPSHATVDGDLIYESLNEAVCKVDKTGKLIPVSVGQTTIEVSTSVASYEEPVVGRITVNVTYADLAYNLNKVSDEGRFKQIYNQAETIELSLVCYDDNCDQNPTIIWYCDETALNAYRNNKLCSYTPDSVPVGAHQIYAKLTDASGRVEFTVKYDLYIYNALEGIDLTITTGEAGSFTENDIAGITIGYVDGQYPPEQFNWYLKGKGLGGTDKPLGTTTEAYFNYRIGDDGDLVVICEPVVKGVARVDLRKEIDLGAVGELTSDGCEIYNLYVEGANNGSEYVPFVFWDNVARSDAEITVQLEIGSQIISMSNLRGAYTDCFTPFGCYIPSSVATLDTTFNVRVGTDGYNYTDSVEFAGGSIDSARYRYLDFIVPGMNGYITNMEEFGKLLNYLNVFHPSNLFYTEANNTVIPGYKGYSIEVYFTFAYSDLDPKKYPTMSTSSDTKESYRNVHNIVSSAINCYCESSKFDYVRTVSEAGEVALVFDFDEFPTSLVQTQDIGLSKVYIDQSYAKTARTSDILPIDSVDESMVVSTSNQLYYALTLGYRPIPAVGSQAETIYGKMRAVLRRIINDNMTQAEKVHAIYDFLSTEVVYDYDATTVTDVSVQRNLEAFYLEGVFLRGRAVCDGIAKSFNSLCRMEGLSVLKIAGMESQNNVGHAWNKVLVEGKWYGIDATWGSSRSEMTEYQNHAYLLTTDGVLNKQHTTYGTYPYAQGQANPVYYGSDITTGVTHTITSIAEVRTLTESYIAPKLTTVGDVAAVEVKLSGVSLEEFKGAIKNAIGQISYAIGSISFADNVYYVYITRK